MLKDSRAQADHCRAGEKSKQIEFHVTADQPMN
jgi:hypothetical protein